MRNTASDNRFSRRNKVKNVKLCSLVMNNETVCEVIADYPVFGVAPKLNSTWLRNVLASAIRSYFIRNQKQPKTAVVKA